MIPATISPITVGWPIFWNNQPNNRQVRSIVMICKSRIPMDDLMFPSNSWTNKAKPSCRFRGELCREETACSTW